MLNHLELAMMVVIFRELLYYKVVEEWVYSNIISFNGIIPKIISFTSEILLQNLFVQVFCNLMFRVF